MLFPVGTSFIDKLVKGNFSMEQHMVPVQSNPVASISEYLPPSDPLSALQSDSDARINTEDRQDNNDRVLLFRVAKVVATPPSLEASVSVTTSSAEPT